MEISTPYLLAIQSIAGRTPGEKQKTLNIIAGQLAKNCAGQPVDTHAPVPDVPEPLKPLVRVEVAKILHRYDAIIEALKSEDLLVVSRALQAKWFFDGSDSSLVNARYFLEKLFPEISLQTRSRVVTNLGNYLRDTEIAADFFLNVAREYGIHQAVPLLVACDEVFAFRMIVEKKIVLSSKMVKALYRRYPDLAIKYLMLSKRDEDNDRTLHQIDIRNYTDFLPQISVKRLQDFLKIYKIYHVSITVKLAKRAIKKFMKTELNLLVKHPHLYLKLLPLKTVTRKLSPNHFARMFKNCFPKKKEDFDYNVLNKHLRYVSESEKIPLILSTFREVYAEDLLTISCRTLVNDSLIAALPAVDKLRYMRLEFEDDNNLINSELAWRYHLPVTESILTITDAIANFPDHSRRAQLFRKLMDVKNDEDALLQILTYIYDHHRNDDKFTLYGCLTLIAQSIDLATLSSAHWEICNKFIELIESRGDSFNYAYCLQLLIEAGLRYYLSNGITRNDYIRILVKMNVDTWSEDWNVVKNYPNFEKVILDLILETLPILYPLDKKIWKDQRQFLIPRIMHALWNFNKRNSGSNDVQNQLSIKRYPWFYEEIKTYVHGKEESLRNSRENLLRQIRNNERDVYNIWKNDLELHFWDFGVDVICDVLHENPGRVLKNWNHCLERFQNSIHDNKYYRNLFVRKIRWYDQLPIKFFELSMKSYKKPENFAASIMTLALFTDGKTYAKIIEPFVSSKGKQDFGYSDAEYNSIILPAIALSLREINPPISLDIIEKFCIGNLLPQIEILRTSVCHRIPVCKVIQFARTLANTKNMASMAHGMRLMCLVAPQKELYTFLTDLWNIENRTSVRMVIFARMYDLFYKQPDSLSWQMMRKCITDLKIHDDSEILRNLVKLSAVPNEYIHEYIKLFLSKMDSMKQESEYPDRFSLFSRQLVGNIDDAIARVLPEKYCKDLLENI